ncbi:aldo/keto reductase [Dysgonomonas capnocytophagoides]|uniref:aldo/keto reductase n=1 Tax=Dysgonomonas capnocytophagoides TaxID=45254 RepID=UPI00292522A9|nr:aldo/keto reductase [Dysgonomonas capnocytophagoides]
MEYRFLGKSGLEVPVLSFGTATFGGVGEYYKAWGGTQLKEATRLIDICLDAGVNLFDTADVYSKGLSEEILGKALAGKSRDGLLLSTKATFNFGEGPNNQGSSRFRLIRQLEGSLKRLNTDYIDIYHMHSFDGVTAVEETLRALDDMVSSGKVRYIAASNFSGWQLMKSIGISDKYGWNSYVAHQVYYSLANREYEWELMPLSVDQNIGTIVWSPLSSGRLGGRYKRNNPIPKNGRIAQGGTTVPDEAVQDNMLNNILDTLREVADEVGKSIAQVAINWVLQRPTVSSVIIGARNEEQLKQNLGAVGWNLTDTQIRKLDEASTISPIYPYWQQWSRKKLIPTPDFYKKQ